MPELIKIKVTPEEDITLHSSMGSVLHGAIMTHLPYQIAEDLHSISLRPFSQALIPKNNGTEGEWRIGFLDDYYSSFIRDMLSSMSELHLTHKNSSVKLSDFQIIKKESYEEIADGIFTCDNVPKSADIFINTAMSFKHDGQYINFPYMSAIYNSLMNKWNSFAGNIQFSEDDLANRLGQMTVLGRYQLSSRPFSVEGRNINGFAGNMRLLFRGNEMPKKVMASLIKLAPYSGIGIKTALGMGNCNSEIIFNNK